MHLEYDKLFATFLTGIKKHSPNYNKLVIPLGTMFFKRRLNITVLSLKLAANGLTYNVRIAEHSFHYRDYKSVPFRDNIRRFLCRSSLGIYTVCSTAYTFGWKCWIIFLSDLLVVSQKNPNRHLDFRITLYNRTVDNDECQHNSVQFILTSLM